MAAEALLASYERVRALLEDVAGTLRAHESLLIVHGASPSIGVVAALGQARGTEAPSPGPVIELHCLGSFRIKVGGAVVDLGSGGKPLAIAKILAARGRPTPREVLVETLWPDSDPGISANRLRVAIHELRRRLALAGAGKRIVRYERGCYLFSPEARVRVDADDFQALWQHGVWLERGDRLAEAIAIYRQAEELYRGDFLADDSYEEWTMMRRETLRDAHLDMLGKLSAWSLEHGQYEDCMVFCQKLLLADPCREDAYRMLMQCHVSAGRPARAHRWFEVCVAALRDELNVDPSPETVALYASLPPRRTAGEVSTASMVMKRGAA
jgi:DNA-binding SARP family transcriptional activator